ncbi:dol-P-Man:Man(7)GlcNAc(2)-PP-Dol alpha-1,6-mannosyltransferase isoform X2 [Phoenix dactylifera]|uniref:Mannosyltransferase n=1 Tax=Phoenix dactylifera TaxID=42345 RepID=A0A8B9AEQ0_PHODC|nr:dol-P-Man:Man(7)GlcNAc(2)-PP-Dol alpha-1,6-mannosyltransferase isoform X2 [Phoenix dactylifera]
MATTKPASNEKSSGFFRDYGWDVMLGTIAALYVIMVPYTKVEESFNVQAMHDMLYHHCHIKNQYDHLDFPGVVPRTFMGALLASILASPVVFLMQCLHMPKVYSLIAACAILMKPVAAWGKVCSKVYCSIGVRLHHIVDTTIFSHSAVQFHLLFYSTRPLPNMLAFGLVNLAYSFWFKGNASATLKCLAGIYFGLENGSKQTFATIVFRCDTMLLFAPIGIELLLSKSISLWKAMKCCIAAALLSIGFTVLLDTVMWQRIVWPELEVFWFNSILNRSSEWGTHPFHWYFTSALPRSLLVAYPLCVIGMLFDRRILRYIVPVLSFVLLYSKLPHKELRFIISSVPVFNVSAAITASRIYINRKKNVWRELYVMMLGSLLVSLGCSIMTFMASYDNYPGAYALNALHEKGASNCMAEKWVHIDAFTAMNGVSRFSENKYPWRYSKEEGIALEEYRYRNFTYLLNEHPHVDGFKCLFVVNGFSKARLQTSFPPIVLANLLSSLSWATCS